MMITSDHGYEFDDLGLGYYGHASNFGPFQLRATLLMQWPGRAAQRFGHRTAHQDLPATLLQGLFGCKNPPADYSMGRNLFDEVSWDWIIAGSYHDHAIVEPGRIMVTEPGGFAEVLGPDYRPPRGRQPRRRPDRGVHARNAAVSTGERCHPPAMGAVGGSSRRAVAGAGNGIPRCRRAARRAPAGTDQPHRWASRALGQLPRRLRRRRGA